MLQRHINGAWNCSSTLPLASALHWGGWSMPHPAAVSMVKGPSTLLKDAAWTTAGPNSSEKSHTCIEVQTSNHPACSKSPHWLCYLGHLLKDRCPTWKLFSLPLLYGVCYRFELFFFFFSFQFWKIAQIWIGQHVHLFQIFESASFLGPAESFLYLCFASPFMFCSLRFKYLQMLDWGFRCLAVWCWVWGLVVSDVSKGRGASICRSQGVVTPWLLQAGSDIRSHPRKRELFSLLSVIQHSTLLFVNLHNV
jgi:hypothetical protein